MTRRMTCLAVALLTFSLPALAQNASVSLAVGTQKVIDIPDLTRVAVGDPTIADIRVVGRTQLLIVGAKTGTTTLNVWHTGSANPTSWTVLVSATLPSTGPRLTVQVGHTLTHPAPNLQRVAIGDPEIADLTTAPGAVQLKGLRPGKTTVILWSSGNHRESLEVDVTP